MKYIVVVLVGLVILSWGCSSTSNTSKPLKFSKEKKLAYNSKKSDTVRIANDSLEYEIVIIQPGFQNFLAGTARPRGFYSLSFLEARNDIFTVNFNQRVNNPQLFDPVLYQVPVNYDSSIDYGYEVNYLLYNYYIFFQLNFDEQLTGIIPRI